MSRAFVVEGEEYFTCFQAGRPCKYATLRMTCELDQCRFGFQKKQDNEDNRQEVKVS